MGVIFLHFVDYVVEVLYAYLSSSPILIILSLSGARLALPMGVAPEAMFGDL
jgi:hypothetical protein